MKLFKLIPIFLAATLQLMPLSRVLCVTRIAGSSTLAVVLQWTVGAVALLGGYHAVSGASTTITSPKTATGTNGVPFSYRITTGPEVANTYSAAPLPAGLTVNRTSGRITGTPTQSGLWSVLLTASDSGIASRTVTATLALTIVDSGGSRPTITTPPQSQTVAAGSNATFTVVAAGTAPLRYLWQFAGTNIAGGTNATLLLNNVQLTAAGTYTVTITNTAGAISTNATLTVVGRPAITTQPLDQMAQTGSNVTFAVVASGAALAYQWRFNSNNMANARSASLNLANVTPARSGFYSVIVSNSAGVVVSSDARLLVVPPAGPGVAPSLGPCRVPPGQFALSFSALAGYRYVVEYSHALSATNWITLTNLPPSFTGSQITLPQNTRNAPACFYRVLVTGP